jgi:hypothetical protein
MAIRRFAPRFPRRDKEQFLRFIAPRNDNDCLVTAINCGCLQPQMYLPRKHSEVLQHRNQERSGDFPFLF